MIHKFTLENGVRVVVEPVTHVQSAAIGLWCKTGSRHEREDEAGITHLIEHMLFKGTKSRTAKQIAESIEGRGGVLNAFTDKESTCYYCRVLADEVANGVEVLSDMMTQSLLEPEEIKREQGVVLEEIKRAEDEPSDHVHDEHIQARWGQHPLGKPIIGTRESVSSFGRDHLTTYMSRQYRGERVILAIAGNVTPDQARELAERWLGSLPPGTADDELARPSGSGGYKMIAKDVEQVHFCIGTDGTSIYDNELHTLAVLDGALGGTMSSRLFQEIREKRGLVYAIGSYSLSYAAGGLYTVYGGTSPATWEQVQELVRTEFDKVIESGFDDDEVERAKRNLSGNLVLALEGMNTRMVRMGRNEMHHERDIPVEETLAKIEAVTNEGLIELARRILPEDKVNTTAIGPLKQ
jgi:predicted Zn-dependent peptidase